ncbi:MAG: MBL fold metallo-hydrolase [Gemmatimonadota bacterium]|nr:MBL fold metallo-hydrolase [Gemmatimonadota bacterium]
MRLYVLGSGSRGNCFAVEAGGGVLLIDAGFSAREIERRAEIAGLALDALAGIVLTHEHGDHACGAPLLARRRRVPVCTSNGTMRALSRRATDAVHHPLDGCTECTIGPFRIRACATSHDAAEPLAVVVTAPSGATLGVAYDLGRPTTSVRYLLRGLTALVLEANYDEVLLRTAGYPPSVQHRIAGMGGHLSNRAAAELLAQLQHPGLGVVVLAHLSQRCNTEECARETVEPALRRAGFRGTLAVARQDEPLPAVAVVQPAGSQLALAI